MTRGPLQPIEPATNDALACTRRRRWQTPRRSPRGCTRATSDEHRQQLDRGQGDVGGRVQHGAGTQKRLLPQPRDASRIALPGWRGAAAGSGVGGCRDRWLAGAGGSDDALIVHHPPQCTAIRRATRDKPGIAPEVWRKRGAERAFGARPSGRFRVCHSLHGRAGVQSRRRLTDDPKRREPRSPSPSLLVVRRPATPAMTPPPPDPGRGDSVTPPPAGGRQCDSQLRPSFAPNRRRQRLICHEMHAAFRSNPASGRCRRPREPPHGRTPIWSGTTG